MKALSNHFMKKMIGGLLIFFYLNCHGQGINNLACEKPTLPVQEKSKKIAFKYPLLKEYCYADRSGKYHLYFTGNNDLTSHLVSSSIEIHLLKETLTGSFEQKAIIYDASDKQEAGVSFQEKLTELNDVDHDGEIDPIFVYRFYDLDKKGSIDFDEFKGRIKIIGFYKGSKFVIRARTGVFDGERRTTANSAYFSLPLIIKKHIINKINNMYMEKIFGFDNSYEFQPQKE